MDCGRELHMGIPPYIHIFQADRTRGGGRALSGWFELFSYGIQIAVPDQSMDYDFLLHMRSAHLVQNLRREFRTASASALIASRACSCAVLTCGTVMALRVQC
eukprot:SAG31_NODE_525_length_14489_cov_3.693815_10_plen_103_part_00